MSSLPYVTAPGNISRALAAIKHAATPQKITQDFVKTVLKIPGGSGNQMASFLRKIGFANADGSPSDLYVMFRNPVTSGRAVANAIRQAYSPLYVKNEYAHELNDQQLQGLIIEETGLAKDSSVVKNVFAAFKALKDIADFSSGNAPEIEKVPDIGRQSIERDFEDGRAAARDLGLNLSYTINLNLPATSDISVFNAIFKSLKENLLRDDDG